MDLMAFLDESISIVPQKSELIPTGISIAIPENTEVQIRPRSGLAAKNNISVFMKIIGLILALTTIILMKNLL